jgi:predicted transcriptional regulator
MKAISLKLPEELDNKVTQIAARRKTTRSAVLREAIEAYAGKAKQSVTAAAGDWVGCVEGPRDLSTNPRHMDGFGR